MDRASGDKKAGLQAALGDGVDEIDAGEDVAIRDAAISRQVDPPLAGSAEHEVYARGQFADALNGGCGVCAWEAHAEAAQTHPENGAIRAEIASERGARYDVADVFLFHAELPPVLDEEGGNLPVSSFCRRHKASREETRDCGHPEAGVM
jgi:hypothetical protein